MCITTRTMGLLYHCDMHTRYRIVTSHVKHKDNGAMLTILSHLSSYTIVTCIPLYSNYLHVYYLKDNGLILTILAHWYSYTIVTCIADIGLFLHVLNTRTMGLFLQY